MNFEQRPTLELEEQRILIDKLTPYGFTARMDLPVGTKTDGTLLIGDEVFDVGFRVRDQDAGKAACSFADLTITNKDKIRRFLADQQRGFTANAALEARTYDELARGEIGDLASGPAPTPTLASAPALPPAAGVRNGTPTSGSITSATASTSIVTNSTAVAGAAAATATAATLAAVGATSIDSSTSEAASSVSDSPVSDPDPVSDTRASGSSASNEAPSPTTTGSQRTATADPTNRGGVKSLAMMLMLLAMIALVVIGAYFMKSRSSLEIDNSALVGNFLPINAKVEGEVVALNVVEGEFVKKGDVLLQLKNPEMEFAQLNATAQLETATAKVISLKKQLASYKSKVKVAIKKFALDMEVAKSELESVSKSLEAATSTVERLRPFVESGSVTKAEFDIADKERLAAESLKVAAENQVKLIEFSRKSASDGILIFGDRIDDEMGRLVSDVEFAEAKVQELTIARELCEKQLAELEVRAPRDGQVYVTYRQVGEYLKVAEQAIALSFEGKVWAAGQVSAGQASRVRPGQPVLVSIPSTGQKFDGVVMAVGHRAMYSRGGYTADFRGTTATDVPVKVMIEDLPLNIQSGIRLQMAINTGFGIEWLDNSMGYELKPLMGTPLETSDAESVTPVAGDSKEDAVADEDGAGAADKRLPNSLVAS